MMDPTNSMKNTLNANNISFSVFDVMNYNGGSAKFHLSNIQVRNIDWNFENNKKAVDYILKSGSFIRAS